MIEIFPTFLRQLTPQEKIIIEESREIDDFEKIFQELNYDQEVHSRILATFSYNIQRRLFIEGCKENELTNEWVKNYLDGTKFLIKLSNVTKKYNT